ncbi:unnamed protein product [Urochloa decumbens]|uniref:DUF295 domain-containing protein n=1 Tax=Urochloa decumbens TaxID=240449 RepID=A0ABC9B4R2_9POAL
MAGTPPSGPWADLPPELAGLVLGRLPAHVDRVRFAAVCPHWRSAARQARLPPPPPLLVLKSGGTFYSMPRGEPLRFAGCEEGFVTASGSWLVYHRAHCLLLVDPLTGATMTLPAPSSVYLPAKDGDDVSMPAVNGPSMAAGQFEVIKLIVCTPDLIAALFWSRENNQIAVCRPGASRWLVAWDLPFCTDMAFYQGKLYAVNFAEILLALDISVDDNTGDPCIARIGHAIKFNPLNNPFNVNRMLYLIESRGSLLLVRRRIFGTHNQGNEQIRTFAVQCEPEFVVFEADFEKSRWVNVMNLGDDQALFLGPCSKSVCMPQCDSLDNRVWFLDDYKNGHIYKVEWESSSSSGPLPMITWRDYRGRSAAAWLFPSK